MTFKKKNIRLGDNLTIPILPVVFVLAFCLWNAVFFSFVMSGDGMALTPKDDIIAEDYPHIVNAFIVGITWGISTTLLLFFVIRHMPAFVFLALHIGGIVCVTAFVYHTTVNATCALPFCG